MTSTYVDQIYPSWLNKSAALNQLSSASNLYWESIPRLNSDKTTEVLIATFKTPVSISFVSFQVRQTASTWSLFYYDRSGVRKPVRDEGYRTITSSIGTADIGKWTTFSSQVYPIVATKFELQITRVADPLVDQAKPYSLGVKNLLLKREILTRNQASQPIPSTIDSFGSVVSHTVKDWDAPKANDDKSFTFWKSEPQPDPSAVVSYYMDVRDEDGGAQLIDRLYLDPVYTGQHLNIYYSEDDTTGVRTLSNSVVVPTVQKNADFTSSGLQLNQSDSRLEISSSSIGFSAADPFWFGLTWVPSFGSAAPGFTQNLTLVNSSAANKSSVFSLYYDTAGKKMVFTYLSQSFASPVFSFTANQVLRLVFGIDNDGYVQIRVMNASGTTLASYSSPSTLPSTSTLARSFWLSNAKGYYQDLILKQDGLTNNAVQQWASDPSVYLSPDPSPVDSTLSNVILGGDFANSTLQGLRGGLDDQFFASKTWSPIWTNWTTQKGFYYFPASVSTKYLKLEFSELTEQQYPIWESGTQVQYKSYPLEVVQMSKAVETSISKSVKTKTTTSGYTVGSNVKTVETVTTSKSAPPADVTVSLHVGGGQTGLTPYSYNKAPVTTKTESTTSTVLKSSSTSSEKVAGNTLYTVVTGDYLIKIAARYNIPWKTIYNLNKSMIDSDPRVKRLPRRYPGWWIFPNQKLKIPTQVMRQILKTTTVTTRKKTTTSRTRFTATDVHKYQVKTVSRDSSIAYFAGIREVTPFVVNYFTAVDTPTYDIKQYTPNSFMYSNVMQDPGTTACYVSNDSATTDITATPLDPTGTGTLNSVTDNGNGTGTLTIPTSIAPLFAGAGTTLPAGQGQINTGLWESQSTFVKLGLNVVDRGMVPQAISATPSTDGWLGSATSSYYYDGEPSKEFTRSSGTATTTSAVAYLTSNPITAPCFVQGSLTLMFTQKTTNSYLLELVDPSSKVLTAKRIVPQIGKWVDYSTYIVPASTTGVYKARLTIVGPDPETVRVGFNSPGTTTGESALKSSVYTSTIQYTVSNDGGKNFYDATQVARDNTYTSHFVFPNPGNQLMIRVALTDPNDYVFGFTATPYYLQ